MAAFDDLPFVSCQYPDRRIHPAGVSPEGWPTTLRFSRRMGEGIRDADYANAIEGPAWRRPLTIEPARGQVWRLAQIIDRLCRSTPWRPS